MNRHTERFTAWYDPNNKPGECWAVIDTYVDDESTLSGKKVVGTCSSYPKAHHYAIELEAADDSL